jgi:phospholipid/cholesterol/gamma-HCH transport system permease protein
MESHPELNFRTQPDGTLQLQLSGAWTLESDIPNTTGLAEKIGSARTVSRLDFDTGEVTAWDSGLLTFLVPLADYCRRKKIAIDPAGLPEGVAKLLHLAYAVPERKGARRETRKRSFVYDVGMDVMDGVRTTGEFIAFLGASVIALGKLLRGRAVYQRSELWRIVQETGAQALPIVSLVSFLVGLILAFVGAVQLEQFGAGIYVADLVGIAMTREMGAIMAGIIMAGRTGAAFAAEIGSMTVNQEIDALKTSGFSPMEFLVLPRMLALMLMMPLLAVYADLMGILGGAAVAVPILDLSAGEYFMEVYKAVTTADFMAGIFMAAVYGVIVAVVGCLRGITCGRSAEAVGNATTSAVVSAIVLIVVSCAIMTVLFNALGI